MNALIYQVLGFVLIKGFSPTILISPRLMHLVEHLSHILPINHL